MAEVKNETEKKEKKGTSNIYKQAAQRQRVVPGGAKPTETPVQEVQNEETVVAQPVEEEKVVPTVQPEEKPKEKRVVKAQDTKKAKGRSVYLSDEVMAALKKDYKKHGFRSVSAYLDAIAKDYFGL